jgi:hypothetical protein
MLEALAISLLDLRLTDGTCPSHNHRQPTMSGQLISSTASTQHSGQQARRHPAILQLLQGRQELLRLPLRLIVILHIRQWYSCASTLLIARTPIILDVTTGKEDANEQRWRNVETHVLWQLRCEDRKSTGS